MKKGQILIIDFDKTYNDEEGINPSVYIIDSIQVEYAKHLSQQAADNWNDFYDNSCPEDSQCMECIKDEFNRLLNINKIKYQLVGSIDCFNKEEREEIYIYM